VTQAPHSPELLIASLQQVLAAHSRFAGVGLQMLPAQGLAHDHLRLAGTGLLARIPKQSQMQLDALANLHYQQACFDRASSSGYAPRCHALLMPSAALPRGALLVDEVLGRAAQIPQDLALLAQCLARIHRIAMPSVAQAAPLLHMADPLQAMLNEIKLQAQYLSSAGLTAQVHNCIEQELTQLQALCTKAERPPRCLISFDGHPGNFVIRPSHASTGTAVADGDQDERAILVDLEKCRYSYASFDIAHLTLYTSTTWDRLSHAVLSVPEVMKAYQAWAQNAKPAFAQACLPWHLPLRRVMWLWSITWCAKWRVTSAHTAKGSADGEDWSADKVEHDLAQHVRERVDHYLSASAVDWVQDEFHALKPLLA
jgi:Ser/Thr protein kinase RdoA (MazF antagonist)